MRCLVALASVGVLLAVSACGASPEVESRVAGPVAADLARRSEVVARLLDQGKMCAARRETRALARAVEETGDALPLAFRREIEPVLAELDTRIVCAASAQSATPTTTDTGEPDVDESEDVDLTNDHDEKKKPKKDKHDHDRGNGQGNGHGNNGKGNGRGNGGDK